MSEFLKYLIIGIIQGITEPLPISSSGHILIAQHFFQLPQIDYSLSIFLHGASLLAILVLFRKNIVYLLKANIDYVIKQDKSKEEEFYYALFLLAALIPGVIAGLLLKDFIETRLMGLATIGLALLITGVFLILVQRFSLENTKARIGLLDAIIIGLVQVLALLPGISRSGVTVVGGLFRKLEFEKVVEFSFMLFVPITLGSLVLEVFSVKEVNHALIPLAAGFIASGVLTYYALKTFIVLVKRGQLKYFSVYCFAMGGFLVVYSMIFL